MKLPIYQKYNFQGIPMSQKVTSEMVVIGDFIKYECENYNRKNKTLFSFIVQIKRKHFKGIFAISLRAQSI